MNPCPIVVGRTIVDRIISSPRTIGTIRVSTFRVVLCNAVLSDNSNCSRSVTNDGIFTEFTDGAPNRGFNLRTTCTFRIRVTSRPHDEKTAETNFVEKEKKKKKRFSGPAERPSPETSTVLFTFGAANVYRDDCRTETDSCRGPEPTGAAALRYDVNFGGSRYVLTERL